MVRRVEVAFARDGEPILTCTFLQPPSGGMRDGLIHAVYGGVWGKPHGVLEGHPRTGDLMPPLVHLGPAAPAGLVRLESSDSIFTKYPGTCFSLRERPSQRPTTIFSFVTMSIFTRPMSLKMQTAAYSLLTQGAGGRVVAFRGE